jgi:hypothetical protein
VSELPGADLVARGLADLARGLETEESLLVEIALSRLRELGHDVPRTASGVDAELRLYERLCRSGVPDPYSSYNALLRRLCRYLRGAEARASG